MNYRITADLSFPKDKKDLADKAMSYLCSLCKEAVIINAGLDNVEGGYAEERECNHDDLTRTIPDVILARWEVGRGKVI